MSKEKKSKYTGRKDACVRSAVASPTRTGARGAPGQHEVGVGPSDLPPPPGAWSRHPGRAEVHPASPRSVLPPAALEPRPGPPDPAALEHRPGPTHLPDTRRGWRGQPAWGGQSGGRTCPTCAALSALRVVRHVPAMTWAAGGRGGSLPATPSKPGGAHPAGPSRTSCTSPSARLSPASCGATLNQL